MGSAGAANALNPEHPYWQPEFLGDAIVVNGKTWPYLDVEPRRYRFRFLNGSNARFYSMRLMDPLSMLPGPPIWPIGTDGGLLDTPSMIGFPNELLIAPGERADVIVDFAKVKPGTKLVMTNTARAPFPQGATPDPQTVGQIMQFRVGFPTGGPDTSYDPAAPGATLRTAGVNTIPRLGPTITAAVPVRQLTLNEVMGAGGPLEALLNNSKWGAGISEDPQVGSTEVWEIINLTGDAHPIHLHLVQFQLLSRRRFQTNKYMKAYDAAFPGGVNPADGLTYPAGVFMPSFGPPGPYGTLGTDPILGGNPAVSPYLQGPARPPAPNEMGWKDTVIMYPGEVTRIVVRWAPQDLAVNDVSAGVNKFQFDPTNDMFATPTPPPDNWGYPAGPGYVWHCHILDHEDNEMMRPYTVAP